MRQTELSLSKRERAAVEALRSKGEHMAREFNRAHILLALDRKVPERQIMEVLGVGRTAIWRTRAAYREGGLEYALHDVARPGKPRRYRAEAEAQVAALACSAPPAGGQALDACAADRGGAPPSPDAQHQPREHPPAAKKNLLKPWRKLMWCIGALTEEYRRRMYDLLELYARPYRAHEPVICIDEKSKQLLRDTRPALAVQPGVPAKYDYEYVRVGTCNVFVAVEPKGGRRVTEVTARRTTPEFVGFVQRLLEHPYASARKVHLVLDNLNTHFPGRFEQVLGRSAARALLQRVQFHYTPKHASWLNMAEIEISLLQRQCLARRLTDRATAAREVKAWQRRRNAQRRGIDWEFTPQDADRKLGHHYVS